MSTPPKVDSRKENTMINYRITAQVKDLRDPKQSIFETIVVLPIEPWRLKDSIREQLIVHEKLILVRLYKASSLKSMAPTPVG